MRNISLHHIASHILRICYIVAIITVVSVGAPVSVLATNEKPACTATNWSGGSCSIFEGACQLPARPICRNGVWLAECFCGFTNAMRPIPGSVPSVSASAKLLAGNAANYLRTMGSTAATAVAADIDATVAAINANNVVAYAAAEDSYHFNRELLTPVEIASLESYIASYGYMFKSTADVVTENQLQVHPSIVNSDATIRYDISEDSFVSIGVVDMMGNLVATVYSGFTKQGSYTVELNDQIAGIANGMYFVQMVSGQQRFLQKIVVSH